ncbi:DUF4145 domain-containing protein [Piscinibacter koreensis]|nr:DUF4145 domain-containing protein [Schlegelella koreensis]
MLSCLGCETVKLRHTSHFSEDTDGPSVVYYPPAIFRRPPEWLGNLWFEVDLAYEFVDRLLKEIYVALQNNLPSLAAMGVRALLEQIMISKVGDQGTFSKNMSAFESQGYVSSLQRKRLETILEAGHAAIHRSFAPNRSDVITLVDIAEHIVETVYLHERKVIELGKRVPPKA